MMQNTTWNKQTVSITQVNEWKQKAFTKVDGEEISIIKTNSIKYSSEQHYVIKHYTCHYKRIVVITYREFHLHILHFLAYFTDNIFIEVRRTSFPYIIYWWRRAGGQYVCKHCTKLIWMWHFTRVINAYIPVSVVLQ